jgi:M6 family metalloprotease-like protein
MKKSKTLRPIYLSILLASCLGYASAAPFPEEGRAITFTQPDGKKLKLRVFGDEHYARTETADGHTVMYNAAKNQYNYATLSVDGSTLVPVGRPVGGAVPAGLVKHVDLSATKINEIERTNRNKFDIGQEQRWKDQLRNYQAGQAAKLAPGLDGNRAAAQATAAQIVGKKVGLTILIQFPNDQKTTGPDPVNFPVLQTKVASLCNDVGYSEDGNSGSVRDYFYDQSLGKLSYVQVVTQIITVPQPRSYYNFSDYPANKTIRETAGPNSAGELLLTDAIKILKATKFNFTGLTLNSAGRAIATNVFFAGDDSGVFAKGLWPHKFSLGSSTNVGTTATPVYIDDYQITNMENSAPVIGTFIHENGHLLLGFPDIYAEDANGEGVGRHCLMGGGNYLNRGRTPAPINAYFKEVVGWGNIQNLKASDARSVLLPSTGNVAYRIRKTSTPTEAFIIENRGAGDKWAQFSPDQGVVVWHIDETIDGNFYIKAGSRYGVALVQADGAKDLEVGTNQGDRRDYFDISDNASLSDSTFPSARWYDSSPSGLAMKVTGPLGPSILVQFGLANPNEITVTAPNGGERIYPVTNFSLSWNANILGNVKIELLKNGILDSVIAANAPNTGLFSWNIAALGKYGSGYAIKVTSLTNPVLSSDTSDTTFSITDGKFPVGDVVPYGWIKPKKVQSTWSATNKAALEGAYSLVSGKTGDGRTSAISYRANFESGTMSFFIKVSSEKDADFAHFSIDGVKQKLDPDGVTAGLSGDIPWVYQSFSVPAGWHTFQWSYEKDDAYASLSDKAWIDGVTFPLTTQEIAVFNAAEVEVVDGEQTVEFPTTSTTRTSAPVKFTIKNVGVSDLAYLSATFKGLNPSDYKVSALAKTALAGGTQITFDVTFSPKTIGPLSAILVIGSDDENEKTTTVNLKGTAFGTGAIRVDYANGKKLGGTGKMADFGNAATKSKGAMKSFVITNTGNATFSGLAISKGGRNKGDFFITGPGGTELAPGASTTFNVTFSPSKTGSRMAQIRLTSSDSLVSALKIKVTGKGTPGKGAVSALQTFAAAAALSPSTTSNTMTSVEVVGSQKFLSISTPKSADGTPLGLVEVSPDLLDWYSGSSHTTTLIDDATTLKVRDNTPITPRTKRYIRVK